MKKLIFVFVFCLIVTIVHSAEPIADDKKDYQSSIRAELGRCLVGYFDNIDLNNDGVLEIIRITDPSKIYTNVPEDEFIKEPGVVIEIRNEAGEILAQEKLEQYIEIDDAHIEENSGGLKQLFISGLNKHTNEWERYRYGFKDGEYKILWDRNEEIR